MTALHLDLKPELGPDHHFHVVPSVGEYLLSSPRVVSMHVASLPSACRSVVVALASLIVVASVAWPFGPRIWYTTARFRSPVSTTDQLLLCESPSPCHR